MITITLSPFEITIWTFCLIINAFFIQYGPFSDEYKNVKHYYIITIIGVLCFILIVCSANINKLEKFNNVEYVGDCRCGSKRIRFKSDDKYNYNYIEFTRLEIYNEKGKIITKEEFNKLTLNNINNYYY